MLYVLLFTSDITTHLGKVKSHQSNYPYFNTGHSLFNHNQTLLHLAPPPQTPGSLKRQHYVSKETVPSANVSR